MSGDTVGDSQSSLKAVAVRVLDLPLSWYTGLPEIKFSPAVKKLLVVTALSTVSILFLAHLFQRRRGKKKKVLPWEEERFVPEFTQALASGKDSSRSSSRQNLSLSLNSLKEKRANSCLLYENGGIFSKFSGSVQSLSSMRSVNSSHSCACANTNTWDRLTEDGDLKLVNIPVTTPENLYLMGMELFEEALRRWEQALTFRSRQAEDEASCSSIKLGAGDAIAEENVEDIISAEFIHKLESLLQRAYRLQEEFEATLGASDPASLANDIDRDTDVTVKDDTEDFCLRDTLSIASSDSFVSAGELSEQKDARNTYGLGSLCHCLLYEEAMHLVEEGKVYCRVLRTEMLECLGDSDFLAKLHCIRQAFQIILSEEANRRFLAETGKKVLSTLIVKARKNPKRFEDAFDQLLHFLEDADHWETTQKELAARGVKHLNFYDIVLDFIIMDSFEDLENPPISVQNIVSNRWLNSSFKETAVASSCWSVLKQKRQQMKIPDGFIAHFYMVCEQISPLLVWGFLGPRNPLHDLCCFLKDQVFFFLKDIFDFEKARYTTVDGLAEDILQLLHCHAELMVYHEADSSRQVNGCIPSHECVKPREHPETSSLKN
ncbi:mitoguardin 1 isoform X2 [Protopterus annectens]|uniref:mitoguardin 1 isoform X2 n=1 Tax=Protopterus annectens TaxID=7888 RepID=UPI001CFBA9EF|nr:mitoguardin 1 isoform X2 [Protopterus annectens]